MNQQQEALSSEIASHLVKEELKDIKASFSGLRSSIEKHAKAHHRTKLDLEEMKAEKDFLQQQNQALRKELSEVVQLAHDKTLEAENLSEAIHSLQALRKEEMESIQLGLNSNEQITRLKYEIEVLKASVRNLECNLNRERGDHAHLKMAYQRLLNQQQLMSHP